jgi:hypothetical protein
MKKAFLALIIVSIFGCYDQKNLTTHLKYEVRDSLDQKERAGNQTEIYFKVVIPKDYNREQIDTISSIIRKRNSLVPRIDIDYFTEKFYNVKPCYARAFYPDDEKVKQNTKGHDIFNQPRDLFIYGNPVGTIE